MNSYVVDTCTLFWEMTASPRLSAAAAGVFVDAKTGGAELVIPFVVLAELYYLNEKQGRPLDFNLTPSKFQAASNIRLVRHEPDDLRDFASDAAVSEMHDRLVVGVARRMGIPCVTSDRSIHQSNLVPVIW